MAGMLFISLCQAFEMMQKRKDKGSKLVILQKLVDNARQWQEPFAVLRLISPQLDGARPAYNMQTKLIGQVIGEALGLAPESADVRKLVEWRSGGDMMGKNAGNFALSCAEVLSNRQRQKPSGVTCKQMNEYLDKLARTTFKKDRVGIFREVIEKTTTLEMKWLIAILLKEVRFGLGDKKVLKAFHPDAVPFYDIKCDLQALCSELQDRNVRWVRTSIEIGHPFDPQRSKRALNVETALRLMKGKAAVVEHKFDGHRMLLHKDGDTLEFWSRNHKRHDEYFHFGEILKPYLPEKCILDGELMTWDVDEECFASRTKQSNHNAARALRKELVHHEKMCFAAFDLLFLGDTALLHLSLRERKQMLDQAIPHVPPVLFKVLPGVAPFSLLPANDQEVHDFLSNIVDAGYEGIVLKDLESKYACGDKSGAWLKVKPDYVKGATDLDVLVMGGYFGQKKDGGRVAQFLCGVADRSPGAQRPSKFLSFCRIGSGFTAGDMEAIRQKLLPFQIPNTPGSRPPCYEVTGSKFYNPDVWFAPPCNSLLLTINSENKLRPTQSFAAPVTPFHPRCHKIHHEKLWYDCLTKQELLEMVAQHGVINGQDYATLAKKQPKPKQGVKRKAGSQPLVPPHMQPTDVSQVQQETAVFQGLLFVICNTAAGSTKCDVSRLIASHGGTVSEFVTGDVTHIIADRPGGVKWSALFGRREIIHSSWVMECAERCELLPIKPRHRLSLCEATRQARREDVDAFGDAFEDEIDEADVRQALSHVPSTYEDTSGFDAEEFKSKHCGDLRTELFRGCVAFFHQPIHSNNPDSRDIAAAALKRLGLEVTFRGGRVVTSLSDDVTHVVVYKNPKQRLGFDRVLKRKSDDQQRLLRRPEVSVVNQAWMEECVQAGRRLEEADFSMRPDTAVDWISLPSQSDGCGKTNSPESVSQSQSILHQSSLVTSCPSLTKLETSSQQLPQSQVNASLERSELERLNRTLTHSRTKPLAPCEPFDAKSVAGNRIPTWKRVVAPLPLPQKEETFATGVEKCRVEMVRGQDDSYGCSERAVLVTGDTRPEASRACPGEEERVENRGITENGGECALEGGLSSSCDKVETARKRSREGEVLLGRTESEKENWVWVGGSERSRAAPVDCPVEDYRSLPFGRAAPVDCPVEIHRSRPLGEWTTESGNRQRPVAVGDSVCRKRLRGANELVERGRESGLQSADVKLESPAKSAEKSARERGGKEQYKQEQAPKKKPTVRFRDLLLELGTAW